MAESKGVKRPEDHKPKVEKPKAEKTEGGWKVSHKGATVTVPEDAFDDFELMDDLGQVEKGNAVRLPSLLKRLVGDDGYLVVMDALRDKRGKVPLEAGAEFVGEVLGAINPNS